MKRLLVILLVASGLTVAGCGGSSFDISKAVEAGAVRIDTDAHVQARDCRKVQDIEGDDSSIWSCVVTNLASGRSAVIGFLVIDGEAYVNEVDTEPWAILLTS